VAGVIFLVSSLCYNRLAMGSAHVMSGRHMVVVLMLVLTLISQFGVSPRMHVLRTSVGEIDNVPLDNPARVEFNQLHVWSTRLEGGILLLGLVLTWMLSQQIR